MATALAPNKHSIRIQLNYKCYISYLNGLHLRKLFKRRGKKNIRITLLAFIIFGKITGKCSVYSAYVGKTKLPTFIWIIDEGCIKDLELN